MQISAPRPSRLSLFAPLAAALLASTSALADVAPGCASQAVDTASPLAAGLLALGVGVGVLLLPRKKG